MGTGLLQTAGRRGTFSISSASSKTRMRMWRKSRMRLDTRFFRVPCVPMTTCSVMRWFLRRAPQALPRCYAETNSVFQSRAAPIKRACGLPRMQPALRCRDISMAEWHLENWALAMVEVAVMRVYLAILPSTIMFCATSSLPHT